MEIKSVDDLRKGDKITVDFTVLGVRKDYVQVRPVGTVAGGSNGFLAPDIPHIIVKHEPKPIELAAGQVWEVGYQSFDNNIQRIVQFVDDHCVVYSFNTHPDERYMQYREQFLKECKFIR